MRAPLITLKITFIIHAVLITWASFISMPVSYWLFNIIVLAFFFWSIVSHENKEPVEMLLVVHILSILMDVIVISVFAVGNNVNPTYQFSLAMAIINLLIKPFSGFIIFRVYQERGGEYISFGSGFQNITDLQSNNPGNEPYENLDNRQIHGIETASPHQTFENNK